MAVIDLGKLTEPAKVLIERVSDLIGGALRPHQIRRIAEADADAKITATVADLQAESLRRRTAQRWLAEEEDKQRNMEAITAAAVPQIKADARPDNIERDWLVNFFDKSRLTSDEEMQQLWAKILAGEANAPGKFSKRTVSLMASLDKTDAEQFQTLCRFNWIREGGPAPVVFDFSNPIYSANGITLSVVTRLVEAGLVSYDTGTHIGIPPNFRPESYGPLVRLQYGESHYAVYPPEKQQLRYGRVGLTRAGTDIASLCAPNPVPAFADYAIAQWMRQLAKVAPIRDERVFPEFVSPKLAVEIGAMNAPPNVAPVRPGTPAAALKNAAAQNLILDFLREAKGPRSIEQIAAGTRLPFSGILGNVTRLTDDGLLERRIDGRKRPWFLLAGLDLKWPSSLG